MGTVGIGHKGIAGWTRWMVGSGLHLQVILQEYTLVHHRRLPCLCTNHQREKQNQVQHGWVGTLQLRSFSLVEIRNVQQRASPRGALHLPIVWGSRGAINPYTWT